MNAFGWILVAIGILLIVMGYKGTQHDVLNMFKNIKQGQTSASIL